MNSTTEHNTVLGAQASMEHLRYDVVIKKGVTLTGGIHNANTDVIAILGLVEGSIQSKGAIIILQGGVVQGDIECTEIRIMGSVRPGANRQEPILIKTGYCHVGEHACVDADIDYVKLVMEGGAVSGRMKKMAEPQSIALITGQNTVLAGMSEQLPDDGSNDVNTPPQNDLTQA